MWLAVDHVPAQLRGAAHLSRAATYGGLFLDLADARYQPNVIGTRNRRCRLTAVKRGAGNLGGLVHGIGKRPRRHVHGLDGDIRDGLREVKRDRVSVLILAKR